MFSIKVKIILAYTLVFGIIFVVFSSIIYTSNKSAAFERLDSNLKSYAVVVQTELEEQLNEESNLDFNEIRAIPREGLSKVKIQVLLNQKTNVINDSIWAIPDYQLKQFNIRDYYKYYSVKSNGADYRILKVPVEVEDKNSSTLFVMTSLAEVESDLHRLFILFLILIPLALILTGVTAYFISNAAFNPISKMIETSKEISGNNLDKRLQLPKSKDEIYYLGKTLNEMIERIDFAFKSQKQFIANASHEIKTPLTVIQTELELASKKTNEKEIIESISTSLQETEILSELTNSLLTLAKIDASTNNLRLEVFRFDELLLESIQKFTQTAIAKNVQLNVSFNDAVEVEADKEMLKRLIQNLISNAIKYSNANSSVDVKLSSENSILKLEIKDYGIGIGETDKAKIFDRFYRSNDIRTKISGSGLGLSIVKEIADLHHGKIDVFSKINEGSNFIFTLPIIHLA